jgi:hypothetical protein
MLALTPTPPRGSPSSSPGQLARAASAAAAADGNAKSVVLDMNLVRRLLRDEFAARKEQLASELRYRADVEFLVAVGRSAFRKESIRSAAEHAKLDLVLFDNTPPPRYVHAVPEYRPAVLARRQMPKQSAALLAEEVELRRWVDCLQNKLRECAREECHADWLELTILVRGEQAEADARAALADAALYEGRALLKHAHVQKPYFNKVPERPRTPTFDEEEEAARQAIADGEEAGRRAGHDEIVLRYGVHLFTVNRVEDLFRQELEENWAADRAQLIQHALHGRYGAPHVALCALHAASVGVARPLLGGLAVLSNERGSWPAEAAAKEEAEPVTEEEAAKAEPADADAAKEDEQAPADAVAAEPTPDDNAAQNEAEPTASTEE